MWMYDRKQHRQVGNVVSIGMVCLIAGIVIANEVL